MLHFRFKQSHVDLIFFLSQMVATLFLFPACSPLLLYPYVVSIPPYYASSVERQLPVSYYEVGSSSFQFNLP